MKISYILYMRFLFRITLALLTLFFIGCQGSLFQVHWDSRQDGHFDIPMQEYEMRVTAYCPCQRCCGRNSDRKTASGHKIKRGDTFVAADRRYPFGTEIIVPGYNNSKPVKVLDRGYAIHGKRLDVFFDSHQKAREWGVKYLPVKVLTN
jgi:3D (Asp-Asp-Asp) domain-containing protein